MVPLFLKVILIPVILKAVPPVPPLDPFAKFTPPTPSPPDEPEIAPLLTILTVEKAGTLDIVKAAIEGLLE
jgi:hypothetical protein